MKKVAASLSATLLSPRKAAYAEALIGVIVALGGNEVTTKEEATKEFPTILYSRCVKWVWGESGRLNIELKDEVKKREHLLDDFFLIEPIDDELLQYLKNSFPQEFDEAEISKVCNIWTESVRKDSRNIFLPPYLKFRKEQKAGFQSGTYDDKDKLLEILKLSLLENIDINFRKSMYEYKKLVMKKNTDKPLSEEDLKTTLKTEEERIERHFSTKKRKQIGRCKSFQNLFLLLYC